MQKKISFILLCIFVLFGCGSKAETATVASVNTEVEVKASVEAIAEQAATRYGVEVVTMEEMKKNPKRYKEAVVYGRIMFLNFYDYTENTQDYIDHWNQYEEEIEKEEDEYLKNIIKRARDEDINERKNTYEYRVYLTAGDYATYITPISEGILDIAEGDDVWMYVTVEASAIGDYEFTECVAKEVEVVDKVERTEANTLKPAPIISVNSMSVEEEAEQEIETLYEGHETGSYEWFLTEVLEAEKTNPYTYSEGTSNEMLEIVEELFPAISNWDPETYGSDEDINNWSTATAAFVYFYQCFDEDTNGWAFGDLGLRTMYDMLKGDTTSYEDHIRQLEEIGKTIGLKMDKNLVKNKITAGQYKVGEDFSAGEYVVFANDDRGYFCVSSDANGSNILFNDNFTYNTIITVKEGEYVELSRCYAVNLKENEDITIDISGEGMFRVGIDLPAGEYKLTSDGDRGYYCIYNDSRHGDIVANDNFTGQSYITIKNGQYIELSRCRIEQ